MCYIPLVCYANYEYNYASHNNLIILMTIIMYDVLARSSVHLQRLGKFKIPVLNWVNLVNQ